MGLESGSKKNIESGRFGYEGIRKETWEDFPSYLDRTRGDSSGYSQLQEAEEIRKILEGITISIDDDDDIDYEATIEATPLKNNIVNVNGVEIDLDKIFESGSYQTDLLVDKELNTFEETGDSKIEQTVDVITDSIDQSSFEEKKTEKENRISSIQNEINDIKERITIIRNSITLGQEHAQRVKEQYPIIYQNYMTSLKLLQSYSPNNSTYSVTNLEDYLQTELEMYKHVLSSFEEYAHVNFEKKEEKKGEVQVDRNTLIIEILNLANNISNFENGFSLADLAAQFDGDSSYYNVEKLNQLKNQYLEMIQNKRIFKDGNKEKVVQEEKNRLIIEILNLMNKQQELNNSTALPELIRQLSERSMEELERFKNAYFLDNKSNVNEQINEIKADAMIEAMEKGIIDVNGNQINNSTPVLNSKQMGYSAFQMLALVSFTFSGLVLMLGTIVILLMK